MNRIQSFCRRVCYLSAIWVLVSSFSVSAELPTEDPPHGPLHPMLAKVIQAGPYDAQWKSLVTHPMPDWFGEDKIGLSAHWGPYAVPGWTPRKDSPYGVAYAEWYWEWLKRNEAVKAYHKEHYGDAQYDDFFDGTENLVTGQTEGFFTENFDADRWMRTFKDAGVKYFFITSKHHDGFCIWDSQYTDRNSMKMGPKCDLYGEMVAAARKQGLRIGLYYSYYEWNNPIYRGEEDIRAYKGCKELNDEDGDGIRGEYVDDFMLPQIKELIDKYHPDYLCFDGEWDHGYPYWRSRQIVAYYYNQAAARGQEVIVNDRFGGAKEGTSGTRGVYGDFKHVEYFANVDRSKPWAMWRGFGNSYGYNRNEHPSNILSAEQVVRMVIDCVSNNGNIEFNIGPKGDGTISEIDLDRLAAMGQWLRENGEAIYGTRTGVFQNLPWGRSTTKGNTVYLHVFDWPSDGTLQLQGLMTKVTKAYLLHDPQRKALKWTEKGKGRLSIDLSGCEPCQYATVIALELESEPVVSNRIFPDQTGVTVLAAETANMDGGLQVESNEELLKNAADEDSAKVTRYNIGFWTNVKAKATWDVELRPNQEYEVKIQWACAPGYEGGTYALSIGGVTLRGNVAASTDGWQVYQTTTLGTVTIGSQGKQTVVLRSESIPAGKALMNVRHLVLTPVNPGVVETCLNHYTNQVYSYPCKRPQRNNFAVLSCDHHGGA